MNWSDDMSFYEEWLKNKNTDEEALYLEYFLRVVPESIAVFHDGNEPDLETAISIINSVSVEKYIEVIDTIECNKNIECSEVPQFSSFNDGIYRIPELLEFEPEGMTFEKIGYQLAKPLTEIAGVKYGENHAKLAASMDLVEIRKRPSNVISTSLGRYLVKFMPEEKKELLKRLILRSHLIQIIIKESSTGIISYRQTVNTLSMTTAVRRRSNVRALLDFVLIGSREEKRLCNIDWQVTE